MAPLAVSLLAADLSCDLVRELTRAAADWMRRNLQEMRAGLRALGREQDARPAYQDKLTSAIVNFTRSVGIAMLAGLIAGAVVVGIGGRLAMRISGILAGPAAAGHLTENQNVVGEITAGGTAFLIVGGAINGTLVGLVYAAVRPLLMPLGRWQPLAFGVLLFLVLGSAIITPQNTDFRRLGPPLVNVTLFALIYVVFGVTLASLTSALDRTAAATTRTRRASVGDTRRRILAILVLAVPVLAATWQTVSFIARILTGH